MAPMHSHSGAVNVDVCSVDKSDSGLHWISQASILDLVPFPSLGDFLWPRDGTRVSCIGSWILYHWATWEAHSYEN